VISATDAGTNKGHTEESTRTTIQHWTEDLVCQAVNMKHISSLGTHFASFTLRVETHVHDYFNTPLIGTQTTVRISQVPRHLKKLKDLRCFITKEGVLCIFLRQSL
jgi:hypothetical protein